MTVPDIVVDIPNLLGIMVQQCLVHVQLLCKINDFLGVILILGFSRVFYVFQPEKYTQNIIDLLVLNLATVINILLFILYELSFVICLPSQRDYEFIQGFNYLVRFLSQHAKA